MLDLAPSPSSFALVLPPPSLFHHHAPMNLYLRGGNALGAMPLVSYAAEASALFANVGGTAAFIAGGLVPLSAFAAPKIAPGDPHSLKRVKRIHALLAVMSLVSNLLAVMYSTMARNTLAESIVAPTASLKELLLGEYALEWTGCNVHFIMGLCGFAATLGLNVWLGFGGAAGKAVACGVASTVLLMISIVNRAVSSGDARVGHSVVGLFASYIKLLLASVLEEQRVLIVFSLCLGIASAVLGLKAVLGPQD